MTCKAFDKRTTSARELLRQVQAERIRKSNPKMELKVDLLGTVEAPLVNFEFVDGTKVGGLIFLISVVNNGSKIDEVSK